MSDQQAKIRHLAEKVMGWSASPGYSNVRMDAVTNGHWNPFTSWADAGVLWEKAREGRIHVEVYSPPDFGWSAILWDGWKETRIFTDSGPAAIAGAIWMATGGRT